jgi:hypothetical protein
MSSARTILGGVLALVAAGSAAAQTARAPRAPRPVGVESAVVLLDRSMKPRSARMVGFGDGSVLLKGESAEAAPVAVALSDLRAVLPEAWWRPDEPAAASMAAGSGRVAAERGGWGVLEFTDGQRAIGRLLAAGADQEANGESLRWESNLLGQLQIPMERLSRVRMEGFATPTGPAGETEQPAAAAGQDQVLLSNGDILTGFVEAVGAQVRVKAGEAVTDVPSARVREIRLAQKPVPPTGTMVWLADGTVVRAERLGGEPDAKSASLVRMVLAADEGRSQRVGLNIAQVRAILPRAEAVVPLSAVRISEQVAGADRLGGGRVRAVAVPEGLLNAADLELPGPMRVDWVLPEGVTALAGWAELPETARAWGRVTLGLGLIDGEGNLVAGQRIELDGAKPLAALELSVPKAAKAATLRATLVAGPFGPIQCRAVLKRVLLAVD